MTTPDAHPPGVSNRENPFLSLLLNVVLPSVILTFLSKPERLGPAWALVIAIAFPIGYGIWDGVRRRRANLFSLVGFASVLLTGGLGLLPTRPLWFALKEAAISVVFAIALIASHAGKRPLIRMLLWNPEILDTGKVERRLEQDGHRRDFERLLFRSSLIVALGLLASAVANFLISMHLLKGTVGGTTEFMEAVGTQTWVTWLVIGLPLLVVMMLSLWLLFRGIERLTGLSMDDLIHGEAQTIQVKRSPGPAPDDSPATDRTAGPEDRGTRPPPSPPASP